MPDSKGKSGDKNCINRLLKKLGDFFRLHVSLSVIVIAALLVEVSTTVMYFASQSIMMKIITMAVNSEMRSLSLQIYNRLSRVEVILDNMSWVLSADLAEPDSLFSDLSLLVENNPDIHGSGIQFVPYYYPEKGRLFEPYALRQNDGKVVTMQIASDKHDYTNAEFYTVPQRGEKGHWSEPYLDNDGAKAVVTSYGVPVWDENGNIVATVNADLSLEWLNEILDKEWEYMNTYGYLISGKHHIMVGEDSVMGMKVIENIRASKEPGYFVMDDVDGKKKHVFFDPVGGNTDWMIACVVDDDDVFGELRRVQLSLFLMILTGFLLFGFIIWRLSHHLERIRKMDEEKERIGSELRVAGQIQQSMLPHNYLNQDDVEIYGALVPARDVGGDLFDYFILDDKVYLFVGDVAGKGVPASLYMSFARALFRNMAKRSAHGMLVSGSVEYASDIMFKMNHSIATNNDSMIFITAFVGVLDLKTHTLHYCNAGHNPPVVMNRDGECSFLNVDPNIPIGVQYDFYYAQQDMDFPSGMALLLYTDGLTEAVKDLPDGSKVLFGDKRMMECVKRCGGKSATEVVEYMQQQVNEFVDGTEQSDDQTLLFMRSNHKADDEQKRRRIVIGNDISEVKRVREFLHLVCSENGVDEGMFRNLNLAVEEWVANVVSYAFADDVPESEKTIEVTADMADGVLTLVIKDRGIPFDPTQYAAVDVDAGLMDRKVGGLGIHLVKNIMDTMGYVRSEDGYNILTLTKKVR